MGNCFASNASNVASHAPEEPSGHSEGSKEKMVTINSREKKSCSNDHQGDNKGDGDVVGDDQRFKGEGVRIRVVVTREELKHILRYREDLKYTSLKQLVGVLRLEDGNRIDPEVGASDHQHYGNWRPALGSIPEEH